MFGCVAGCAEEHDVKWLSGKMYHESVFSLRKEATKLSSAPAVGRFYYSDLDKSKLTSSNEVLRLSQASKNYGAVLAECFCAIDPVDTGNDFYDDALGDRPRLAFAFQKSSWRQFLLYIAYCVSGGVLWLLLHWFPFWAFVLTHSPCRFANATHVVIQTQSGGEEHVVEVFLTRIDHTEARRFDNWPPLCFSCFSPLSLSKNQHSCCSESPTRLSSCQHGSGSRCRGDADSRSCIRHTMPSGNSFSSHEDVHLRHDICRCHETLSESETPRQTFMLMFQFRLIRYYLNLRRNVFDIAQFDVQLTPAVLHATLGRGLLSPQIYTSRQQVFGASKDVLAYPLWRMVLEEIADPFYVFQLLSVALWIWDDYLEYAYVVLILMVVSSYYEIRNARACEKRVLRLQLNPDARVNVFRRWMEPQHLLETETPCGSELYENEMILSEGFTRTTANDLLPGDVFEVERDMVMPCDAVLLWGSVVVSEAVLSGEFVPQTKISLPGYQLAPSRSVLHSVHMTRSDDTQQNHWGTISQKLSSFSHTSTSSEYTIDSTRSSNARDHQVITRFKPDQDTHYMLYAATEVLALRPPPKGQRILALCVRTRFLSLHGRLIRSLLFPHSPHFDFNAQALRFLAWLSLCCMVGVIVSIVTGILYNFGVKITVIRTLDLFTDAIPPALPAVLSMGIVVAIKRLQSQHQIYCINAGRVNLAGQVDTFVFDKTGTLTEQGLEFNGCFQVESVAFPVFAPTRGRRNASSRLDTLYPARPSAKAKFSTLQDLRKHTSSSSLSSSPAEKVPRFSLNSLSAAYPKQTATSCAANTVTQPRSAARFGPCRFDPADLGQKFIQAIATCHSLSLVGGRVVGDPLEMRMLQFTCWTLHAIQQEAAELCEALGPASNHIHGKSEGVTCKMALKAATKAIIDLYDSADVTPTIVKPPGVQLSLLQQLRRGFSVAPEIQGLSQKRETLQDCSLHASSSHQKRPFLPMKRSQDVSGTKKSACIKPPVAVHELGILRRFEFSSALQRVTVIVRDPLTQQLFAFCKGSAEAIADLCLSASLPATYYSSVAHYTQRGARVVVVAGKPLGRLSGRAVMNFMRPDIESKLTLLGCVVFTNRLKPDTKTAINELLQARCRCILATGDNPLTALAVAKSCGIVRDICLSQKDVILGDLYFPRTDVTDHRVGQKSYLIWTKIERSFPRAVNFSKNPKSTRDHCFRNRSPSPSDHDRLSNCSRQPIVNVSSSFGNREHLIKRILRAHGRKRMTFDLRDFLRDRNPRDFEFVLTGRAFRKIRMIHEKLKLPWYGDFFRPSIPQSSNCASGFPGPVIPNTVSQSDHSCPQRGIVRSDQHADKGLVAIFNQTQHPRYARDEHPKQVFPCLPRPNVTALWRESATQELDTTCPKLNRRRCGQTRDPALCTRRAQQKKTPLKCDPQVALSLPPLSRHAASTELNAQLAMDKTTKSKDDNSTAYCEPVTAAMGAQVGRFQLEHSDDPEASCYEPIFHCKRCAFFSLKKPCVTSFGPRQISSGYCKTNRFLKRLYASPLRRSTSETSLHFPKPVCQGCRSFSLVSDRSSWVSVPSLNIVKRTHQKIKRTACGFNAFDVEVPRLRRRKLRQPEKRALGATSQPPLLRSSEHYSKKLHFRRVACSFPLLTAPRGAATPCSLQSNHVVTRSRKKERNKHFDFCAAYHDQHSERQNVFSFFGGLVTRQNSPLIKLRVSTKLNAWDPTVLSSAFLSVRSLPCLAARLTRCWIRLQSRDAQNTDTDNSDLDCLPQQPDFDKACRIAITGVAIPCEATVNRRRESQHFCEPVVSRPITNFEETDTVINDAPQHSRHWFWKALTRLFLPRSSPLARTRRSRTGSVQKPSHYGSVRQPSLKEPLISSLGTLSSDFSETEVTSGTRYRETRKKPIPLRVPSSSTIQAVASQTSSAQWYSPLLPTAKTNLFCSTARYPAAVSTDALDQKNKTCANPLETSASSSSALASYASGYSASCFCAGPVFPTRSSPDNAFSAAHPSPVSQNANPLLAAVKTIPQSAFCSGQPAPSHGDGAPVRHYHDLCHYSRDYVFPPAFNVDVKKSSLFVSSSRLAHKGLIPAAHNKLMLLTVVLVKPSACFPVLLPSSSTEFPLADYKLVRMSLYEYLLRNTRIYARMLPEDKTSLITALQSLSGAPVVGMCGDSANDCGALRAADVGVSLNDAAASVAAPFISHQQSIHSCVAILREGRSSLANALHMFQFVVFYSIIQYASVVLLYVYGLNFTDNQYMLVDFGIILPLSFFLSETKPVAKLGTTLPNANLLSKSFALVILLQSIVAIFWMLVLLLLIRFTPGWKPFFVTPEAGDSDGAEIASYENTALFYLTNFQYLILCCVSVTQKCWRQKLYYNTRFVSWSLLLLAFFLSLLLYPRPPTIFPPTPDNPSPVPHSVPDANIVTRAMVILDQWLVVVALPGTCKLLICFLVFLNIASCIFVHRVFTSHWVHQEQNMLKLKRSSYRGPIPRSARKDGVTVYHVL